MEIFDRHAMRRLRRAKNLKQSELAARMGTRQAAVSKWEIGTTTPNLDSLRRMAMALGCEESELINPPPGAENGIPKGTEPEAESTEGRSTQTRRCREARS